MFNIKYPKLNLRTKDDLYRRLFNKRLSIENMQELVEDCLKNKNNYWKDNIEHSKPEDDKYVRNASGTNLGKLLSLLDGNLLKPYDKSLPSYVMGGVQGRSNISAAKKLLGSRRKRVMLQIDLTRFFEQVSQNRVMSFFAGKTGCSKLVAEQLSELCCVEIGKQGSNNEKVLARGFATSSRLAIWTNINLFMKISELMHAELKGKDPQLVVYVDDIGITASRVSESKMLDLRRKIKHLLLNFDDNHKLEMHSLNSKKGKNPVKKYYNEEDYEFVGVQMKRNELKIGKKSKNNIENVKTSLTKDMSPTEKKQALRKLKGMYRNKKRVESA